MPFAHLPSSQHICVQSLSSSYSSLSHQRISFHNHYMNLIGNVLFILHGRPLVHLHEHSSIGVLILGFENRPDRQGSANLSQSFTTSMNIGNNI